MVLSAILPLLCVADDGQSLDCEQLIAGQVNPRNPAVFDAPKSPTLDQLAEATRKTRSDLMRANVKFAEHVWGDRHEDRFVVSPLHRYRTEEADEAIAARDNSAKPSIFAVPKLTGMLDITLNDTDRHLLERVEKARTRFFIDPSLKFFKQAGAAGQVWIGYDGNQAYIFLSPKPPVAELTTVLRMRLRLLIESQGEALYRDLQFGERTIRLLRRYQIPEILWSELIPPASYFDRRGQRRANHFFLNEIRKLAERNVNSGIRVDLIDRDESIVRYLQAAGKQGKRVAYWGLLTGVGAVGILGLLELMELFNLYFWFQEPR